MAGNYVQQGLDWLTGTDRDEEDKKDARIARGKAAFARAGGSFTPHAGLEGAAHMIGKGFSDHSDAAKQINSAIDDEMESRVAQERERRRMEHEKELMRLRLEAQRRDQDGSLIRSLLGG